MFEVQVCMICVCRLREEEEGKEVLERRELHVEDERW